VVSSAHLGYAHSLVEGIPAALSQQLHDPTGACLVIYALLMNVSQQKLLPAINADERSRLPTLAEQINALGSRTRLPLIDLSLPALQRLDTEQKRQLLANIDWLIKADGQVTLAEFLVRELVRRRMQQEPPTKVNATRLEQLAPQVQLLLSMLIHVSTRNLAEQQQLFASLARPLLPAGRQLLPIEKCSLKSLASALDQLRGLTPLLKKPLLDTCADIILADRKVQVEEVELLRLVCLLMDCPIPPLITGEDTMQDTV
jgi:hypothetical protein